MAADRADLASGGRTGAACERRSPAGASLRPKLARRPHRALQPKIAALAVLVCDPETRTQVEQSLLHQIYRLTPTEARLVAALAQGERLESAAKALGVTLGTGRTYLKRVFLKMGVSRQIDLMRLVLSGPTQFSSD